MHNQSTHVKYEYYYNNVPGIGLCRNNLIYTSLISEDKKIFVQHYVNDSDYHKGMNQVVDPNLMEQKWDREICYLRQMSQHYPELVPKILDIDTPQKKIYLEIDGVDFWQLSLDNGGNFDSVLPDWQDQMLDIIKAHKTLGWYKYSMHPSSYFVVGGKLKSINYFFTYFNNEGPISIADHQSHLSETRQLELRKHVESMGIDWNTPQSLDLLEQLCWKSFETNYPADFVNKVRTCIK
jgi:calcineurin-like phosphoesterase family protein